MKKNNTDKSAKARQFEEAVPETLSATITFLEETRGHDSFIRRAVENAITDACNELGVEPFSLGGDSGMGIGPNLQVLLMREPSIAERAKSRKEKEAELRLDDDQVIAMGRTASRAISDNDGDPVQAVSAFLAYLDKLNAARLHMPISDHLWLFSRELFNGDVAASRAHDLYMDQAYANLREVAHA